MANPLVGCIVRQVFLADDNHAIKFVLDDDSEVVAYTDGDCCSYTWIENVENVDALIGREIMSVEDTFLRETDNNELKFYGCNISSIGGGTCKIDYRNVSNGYYGGDLVWPDSDHSYYGGVFGQNKSKEVWKEVK